MASKADDIQPVRQSVQQVKVSNVVVFALAVAAACAPHANVAPNEGEYACAIACENLKQLGCWEGNPTDMHEACSSASECAPGQSCSANGICMLTCVNFCTIVVKEQAWADPSCVARISTCSQIHECPPPRVTR